MRDNPLKAPILSILKQSSEGISEHQLIKRLKAEGVAIVTNTEDKNLALFQTHFLVMNALYQLQDALLAEECYLAINPLCIRLEPLRQIHGGLQANSADAKLKAFYLDWSQLEQTNSTDVDTLLNNFWERYLAIDKHAEALQTLGVTGEGGWPEIKDAYRRLVAEHHPDRGGDPERFMAIREAYEILSRCYKT